MAKIINLNTTQNNSIYNEQLEKMVEFINETIAEIDTYAINLACEGDWKDWNKEQEIAAEISFDLAAIYEVKDPNIQKLFELKCKLIETISCLKQQ